MALISKTAVRGDPVLNHNFVISLIDSSSTLAIVKSAALSGILDVAVGGLQRVQRTGDVFESGRVPGRGEQRRGPQVPDTGRVVEHHLEEGHRRRDGICGTGTMALWKARASDATASWRC